MSMCNKARDKDGHNSADGGIKGGELVGSLHAYAIGQRRGKAIAQPKKELGQQENCGSKTSQNIKN